MQELKPEHFAEYMKEDHLNTTLVKFTISEVIKVYLFAKMYYENFIIETGEQATDCPPDQKEGLEKFVQGIGLIKPEDFLNYEKVFNAAYEFGIKETSRIITDPSEIVDPTVGELHPDLSGYDKGARQYIAQVYSDTFNKNMQDPLMTISDFFQSTGPKQFINGEFNTRIRQDSMLVSEIYRDYARMFAEQAIHAYVGLAEQTAESDTKEMEKFLESIQTFKKKYVLPTTAAETQDDMLSTFMQEYMSIEENKHLIEKYPTIINWVVFRNQFYSAKFKNAIINRFKKMDTDMFEIEKLYLISTLKKDANYAARRKEIIKVVEQTKKFITDSKKTLKEKQEKVDNLYEKYGNDEAELKDRLSKIIIN